MLQGTIVFMPMYVGTKSESIQPFLYQGKANFIQLYVQNDNPFENNMLEKFDGKNITITEYTFDNGVCVINSPECITITNNNESYNDESENTNDVIKEDE